MFKKLHTTRNMLPKLCPARYSARYSWKKECHSHILLENHICLNSLSENHKVQQHVTDSQDVLEERNLFSLFTLVVPKLPWARSPNFTQNILYRADDRLREAKEKKSTKWTH